MDRIVRRLKGDVELAVAVEIGSREPHAKSGVKLANLIKHGGRLKGSVAVAQGEESAGRGHIQLAIAVKIRGDQVSPHHRYRYLGSQPESSVPISQVDLHDRRRQKIIVVADGDIGYAIAIEIAGCNAVGGRPRWRVQRAGRSSLE